MKSKFLVPFETAQLLKEKGYNSLCDCYYEPDKELYLGRLVSNMDYEDCGNCSAPTYHEVLSWLEGKGICVFTNYYDMWAGFIRTGKKINDVNIFHTREEALNAGILAALEML